MSPRPRHIHLINFLLFITPFESYSRLYKSHASSFSHQECIDWANTYRKGVTFTLGLSIHTNITGLIYSRSKIIAQIELVNSLGSLLFETRLHLSRWTELTITKRPLIYIIIWVMLLRFVNGSEFCLWTKFKQQLIVRPEIKMM